MHSKSLWGLRGKKKHFCWQEKKDLPVRSAWDNSIQPINIDPVLSLPGLQPIICLIPSDFGERNNSGSSSIYCNTGTTEGHSKPSKPRPCTAAAQRHPRKPPTCLTSCLRRNNIPFKLSCCSLLLRWEKELCVEQSRSQTAQSFGLYQKLWNTLSRDHCAPQPSVEREKAKWEGKEADISCD